MKYTVIQTAFWPTIRTLSECFDEKTLFVWDVDGTLIYPNDVVFYPQYIALNPYTTLAEEIECTKPHGLSDSRAICARWYDAWSRAPFVLMHPDVPTTIKNLQAHHITNIALTYLLVRNLDGRDFVQWRVDQLKRLEIDFSGAFDACPRLQLDEVLAANKVQASAENWVYAPAYQDGVLLTHNFSKSLCLEALLRRLKFLPKCIFFVDDLEDNVQVIGELCKKLDIDFVGIHYVGVQHLPGDWTEEKVLKKWSEISK